MQHYIEKIFTAPVYDVAIKTPLDAMPRLSDRLGHNVLCKREDLQPVFSFKLRGAYTKMYRLSAEERARGVICASAGNHAQGVALSANRLGMRAVIVMPVTTPQIKIDAVRRLGGAQVEVVLHGDFYDAASQHARELQTAHGYTYIHPFDDPDVIHVDGKVDPASDMETINTELILADLQTLENAIPRLEKAVKIKKGDAAQLETYKQAQQILEDGNTIFSRAAAEKLEMAHLKELNLLTAKPFIYVFNADDGVLASEEKQAQLRELVAPAEAVFLDAKLEADMVELSEEEAREMLEMSGQDESGLDKLARVGFSTLGLQTYLTAGPKESRAWTIYKGDTAPQAAGVIHSDFERGFIKAEVVSFDDLDAAGSMNEAKARGKVRMEGKDYIMADGDVVEFRFNV